MRQRHPSRISSGHLPTLWLLSDARNDDCLERALGRLPRGSGFVFRHTHLPETERRARFDRLARMARARGLMVILAGPPRLARLWGADGSYGPPRMAAGLHLASVHGVHEIGRANRLGVAAMLLSPIFPTRSHPGATVLGSVRFRLAAALAQARVIALGGMNAKRARALKWQSWAAIDGLSCAAIPNRTKDS